MADLTIDETISFRQTSRNIHIGKASVRYLTDRLQPRGPEQLDLFTEYNRPINRNHRNQLYRYFADTEDWAIPAITLSCGKEDVKSVKGSSKIRISEAQVLDGQHRTEALTQLLRDLTTENSELAEQLGGQEVAVLVYEVENAADHRQLFAWFARQRPIEPAVRDYYDERDAFGAVAKRAIEQSEVLKDNVTWQRTSVPERGPESSCLISLRQLKELAAVIQVGTQRSPNATDRSDCKRPENRDALTRRLVEFFDEFLPGCHPHYDALGDPGSLRNRISSLRNTSYAVHHPVMKAMADAYARWTVTRGNGMEAMQKAVSGLIMKPEDPANDPVHTLRIMAGSGRKAIRARDLQWSEANKYMLELATNAGQGEQLRTA